MKIGLYACALLFFAISVIAAEELLLVVEVSRHGARSPSKVFGLAKDP